MVSLSSSGNRLSIGGAGCSVLHSIAFNHLLHYLLYCMVRLNPVYSCIVFSNLRNCKTSAADRHTGIEPEYQYRIHGSHNNQPGWPDRRKALVEEMSNLADSYSLVLM